MINRVTILHETLEWAEQGLASQFVEKGLVVNLLDIRTASTADIIKKTGTPQEGVVLNRVYASVANRNYKYNLKTLEILKELEDLGYDVINSYQTSLFDYSKFDSAKKMLKDGISTPDLILIKNVSVASIKKATKFAKENGYPLILKRNMSGRGKDLFKIENENELIEKMNYVFSDDYVQNYAAGFVLQKFVVANRPYDCRIAIVDDKFAFAYGRTLISRKDNDEPWLASVSNGSKIIEYTPSIEEINLAKAATRSVGALFNEVDMNFSAEGPVIIENNPTPNYDPEEIDLVKNAVELMIKKFQNK